MIQEPSVIYNVKINGASIGLTFYSDEAQKWVRESMSPDKVIHKVPYKLPHNFNLKDLGHIR